MSTPNPTHRPNTTPAPSTETPRPRLYHLRHHIDADGTVHSLCGTTHRPGSSTGKRAQHGRVLCPACEAAAILMGVNQ